MQSLYISPTKITPEIIFSPDKKIFSISGISSPEDVRALYYPVIEWITAFIEELIKGADRTFGKEEPIKLSIDLSYFNSSSAKFLFDILVEFKRIQKSGIPIIIEWYSEPEDQDLRDAGADISQLAEMEFTFIQKIKGQR